MVYVFTCMHTYVRVRVHICIEWLEVDIRYLPLFFSFFFHLIFLKHSLSLNLKLSGLPWLASQEAQWSICLYLPSAGITRKHWHIQLFVYVLGVQTQLLILEQRTDYWWSHLSSPCATGLWWLEAVSSVVEQCSESIDFYFKDIDWISTRYDVDADKADIRVCCGNPTCAKVWCASSTIGTATCQKFWARPSECHAHSTSMRGCWESLPLTNDSQTSASKQPNGPADMDCWAVALRRAKRAEFWAGSQILLLSMQRLHWEYGQGRLLRARQDFQRRGLPVLPEEESHPHRTRVLEVGRAGVRNGSMSGHG